MKIVIVEVEQSEYKTINNITLNTKSGNFEDDCLSYELTVGILSKLYDDCVYGWVDGFNMFGMKVKRVYMLVK